MSEPHHQDSGEQDTRFCSPSDSTFPGTPSRTLDHALRALVDLRPPESDSRWVDRVQTALNLLPGDQAWPQRLILLQGAGHTILPVREMPGDTSAHDVLPVARIAAQLQLHAPVTSGREAVTAADLEDVPDGCGSDRFFPVWSRATLLGFWCGCAGSGKDIPAHLAIFNDWLAFSWELNGTLRERVPVPTGSNDLMSRWLGAESLRSLCVRAYNDLRVGHQVSQLLIVSYADGEPQSWAIAPPDESLSRRVDQWLASKPPLSPAIVSGSDGGVRRLQQGMPLADAGYRFGSAIETGRHISYMIFWGLNAGPDCDRPRDPRHPDADTVYSGPLWRPLEIALTNMARLEYLRELSHIDSITGVFNRRHFNMRLVQEIARARRFDRPIALAVFDLDRFKIVNDTYGHQMGDAVLLQIAEFVRRTVRSVDVFCRLGGDEFAVLMPDAGLDDCRRFGERLRTQMAAHRIPIDGHDTDVVITISIGGAICPAHAIRHDRLFWCADMALLEAKQRGRNCLVVYDETIGSGPVDRERA